MTEPLEKLGKMSVKKRLFIALIVAGILLTAFGNSEVATITLSDCVGKSAEEAKDALVDQGISSGKIEVVSQSGENLRSSDTLSEWLVTEQDPTAGTEVKSSSKVYLTVTNPADQEIERVKNYLDGMEQPNAQKAYKKLQKLGYTVQFEHSVTGEDYTELVIESFGEDEALRATWLVTDYDNLNTTDKTVTLLVNTKQNIKQIEKQQAMQEALEEKLDANDAWEAAEKYGQQQYPYGFDLHSTLDKIAEEPYSKDTWYLKATCDVTNAYDAEMKGLTCEARVTGTNSNPKVVYFEVY